MKRINQDNIDDYYGNEKFSGWVLVEESLDIVGEELESGSYIHFMNGNIELSNDQPSIIQLTRGMIYFIWLKNENYHREYGPAIISIPGSSKTVEVSELLNKKFDSLLDTKSEEPFWRNLGQYYNQGKKIFPKKEDRDFPLERNLVLDKYKQFFFKKLYDAI